MRDCRGHPDRVMRGRLVGASTLSLVVSITIEVRRRRWRRGPRRPKTVSPRRPTGRRGAAVSQLSIAERIAHGKAARNEVPRAGHAVFEPLSTRPDPVRLLERQAKTRVPELVPIRYRADAGLATWRPWMRVPVVMFMAVALVAAVAPFRAVRRLAAHATRTGMDPATAHGIASQNHVGQRDRFGDPIIDHLTRVAAAVPPEARTTALLHDLLELAQPRAGSYGARASPVLSWRPWSF